MEVEVYIISALPYRVFPFLRLGLQQSPDASLDAKSEHWQQDGSRFSNNTGSEVRPRPMEDEGVSRPYKRSGCQTGENWRYRGHFFQKFFLKIYILC